MDHVEVKLVGRFHRIWINGELLVRKRGVRIIPREFMTEEQAWGFLSDG